jgi:ribosomal protein S18 acetylase RimI-like enzyme
MKELVAACQSWPLAPPGTPAQKAAWFATTLEGAAWVEAGGAAAARIATPWDSEQLGVPAARLVLLVPPAAAHMASTLVAQGIAEAVHAGVKYLVARVDASELAVVQQLEAAGFRMLDTIVSQYREVGPPPVVETPGYVIRAAVPGDADALERLAGACFTDTRYHMDPWVGRTRASAIYGAWSAGCARGRNPFTAVACTDAGHVVAFLTAREVAGARDAYGRAHARVELVAVDERHRGRRLVDAMSSALLAAAPGLGWEVLGIGTQAFNTPAMRAYRRVGYAPADAVYTLRWLGMRPR